MEQHLVNERGGRGFLSAAEASPTPLSPPRLSRVAQHLLAEWHCVPSHPLSASHSLYVRFGFPQRMSSPLSITPFPTKEAAFTQIILSLCKGQCHPLTSIPDECEHNPAR